MKKKYVTPLVELVLLDSDLMAYTSIGQGEDVEDGVADAKYMGNFMFFDTDSLSNDPYEDPFADTFTENVWE